MKQIAKPAMVVIALLGAIGVPFVFSGNPPYVAGGLGWVAGASYVIGTLHCIAKFGQ